MLTEKETKGKRAEIERQLTAGFAALRSAMLLLAAMTDGAESDRIPHPRWGFPTRRMAAEKAAAGEIRATKVGKTWYATRADLDAYFARHAAPVQVEPSDGVLASVDLAMRRRVRR